MSCHCWACPSFKHKFHGHNFTVESLLAIFWLHSIMLLCWVELHCFGTVLGMGMLSLLLERFSFECRKVIGFALSTRCDWLKRFAPPFHPIRSKTKANCDALACIFPRFASATCNYFEFWLVQCQCLCPMWLARVITLVLVLRHSNENHSICWHYKQR